MCLCAIVAVHARVCMCGLEVPARARVLVHVCLPGTSVFVTSWEEGMHLSLLPVIDAIAKFDTRYWSAASPATPVGQPWATAAAEPFLLIDGGDYENIHLIGMLQRRVPRGHLQWLPRASSIVSLWGPWGLGCAGPGRRQARASYVL